MSDAEEPSWPVECRSCDAALHGPFCSVCGESHKYGRLELRALAEDAFEGLVNLDTRVLRTVGDLTVAPARVCRDYLDGRRVPYINPFKYALATFAFAYLVAQVLLYQHGAPDGAQALVEFQMQWGQLLNFVAMPVLAAFMLPLFFNAPRQLRWTEHYVLVLFAFGQVALFQGLLRPLVLDFGGVGAVILGLVPIAYLSWMAVGVYQTRWWTTVPRVLVAYIGLEGVSVGIMWLFVPELLGGG